MAAALVILAAIGLWGGGRGAPALAADVSAALLAYTPPQQEGDGWAVASPRDAGLDEVALVQLTEAIRSGEIRNTHAVVIEHSGRLVYEEYFAGKDERWGDPLGHVVFHRETLHDLRSVTKSVTSALLGIALGGDYEAALETPITQYFPDLNGRFGKGVEAVTLRHVLTMTAGLEWNEMTVPYTDRNNDEIQLYYTRDPVAMVLSRPVRDPVGTRWYYNGGLTQVLAGIIERRTGRPIDKYAEAVLFEPLGITAYEWLGSSLWPPGSSPSAASGLRLRARDLAKIGSLFLHDGLWNGKRVIPAAWIALSTERHVQDIPWSAGGVYGYGFMWYPGRSLDAPSYPIIKAMGNGDQRIYILPQQELVVTIFAGLYNRFDLRTGERILRHVLAARKTGG